MTRRSGLKTILGLALAAFVSPAWAHPHVWVTAKADIVFAPDGKIKGIRHSWTFDEAYTAYVTQGLDTNNDGKLTPDEMQELANQNTESLSEFNYFTIVKVNGKKQAFDPPREPAMALEKDQAVLTFFLPLKVPLTASGSVAMEIDDPSFFVYFTLGDGKASIKLAGAPQGCVTTVAEAKQLDMVTQQMLMDEGVFQNSPNQNFGTQYSNKAIVACP
jgi:ABC-type uncharacterized transport system substrate-binding protein